jgi:hypothetical protein
MVPLRDRERGAARDRSLPGRGDRAHDYADGASTSGGGMSQGIILLLVLAAIVAYVITRTRRRIGLLVTGKTWVAIMTGFVIIVLAAWAATAK